MVFRAALPIDSQNYKRRLEILPKLQEKYDGKIDLCGLEIITWQSRDFREDDQGKHFREFMSYVADQNPAIKHVSVFYIYHMTETSKILREKFHFFQMVVDELKKFKKKFENRAQCLEAGISFHHHCIVPFDEHPLWADFSRKEESEEIFHIEEVMDYYSERKAECLRDIQQMLAEAGSEIDLNLEITAATEFYKDKKWEILNFLPEQLVTLIKHFPALGITFDLCHMALGVERSKRNAFSLPFKIILNQYSLLSGQISVPPSFSMKNHHSLKYDYSFETAFQMLSKNIRYVHLSACTGMDPYTDHGLPINTQGDLIDWNRVFTNIQTYCPLAILVPEIVNSHIDKDEVALQPIKVFDFIKSYT